MPFLTGLNAPRFSQYTTDQFTGNGTTTTFSLSRTPPSPSALIVTIDGIKQHSSTYTIGTNQIIFSEAPPNGSSVECISIGSQGIAYEVGDASVTTQKIAPGAVTRSKLDVVGDGSGALGLPYGISASRPSTLEVGQIRYNTDTGMVEAYHGTTLGWVALSNLSIQGRLLSVQTFIPKTNPGNPSEYPVAGANYTWTKPEGCTKVLVYVTGGGGGARCNSSSYRGAGGGGAGTAIKYIDVSGVSTVAVTVGAGGGYAYNGGRGGTGGTSSFGGYCSATGGIGGQTDSPYEGGLGGYASGGDINVPGGGGEMSHDSNREGGGGSSFWHKAGSSHHNGASDGSWWVTHGQWGSGGGYGHYSQNYPSASDGGTGVVIVYNYS